MPPPPGCDLLPSVSDTVRCSTTFRLTYFATGFHRQHWCTRWGVLTLAASCVVYIYVHSMTATLVHREDPAGTQLKAMFRNAVYINFPWTVAKALGHFPPVEYLECLATLQGGRDIPTYAALLSNLGHTTASLHAFLRSLDNSIGTLMLSSTEDVRALLTPQVCQVISGYSVALGGWLTYLSFIVVRGGCATAVPGLSPSVWPPRKTQTLGGMVLVAPLLASHISLLVCFELRGCGCHGGVSREEGSNRCIGAFQVIKGFAPSTCQFLQWGHASARHCHDGYRLMFVVGTN